MASLRRSGWRVRRSLLALLLAVSVPAQAEPLPADSGILNVRDFGAKGDGRTDDTAAILAAVAASGDWAAAVEAGQPLPKDNLPTSAVAGVARSARQAGQ